VTFSDGPRRATFFGGISLFRMDIVLWALYIKTWNHFVCLSQRCRQNLRKGVVHEALKGRIQDFVLMEASHLLSLLSAFLPLLSLSISPSPHIFLPFSTLLSPPLP